MRRAVTIGLAVTAFLIFLGLPFLRIQFGNPDDRVLPRSASTHQVGDLLREDFPSNLNTAVSMVIPDAAGIDRYSPDEAALVGAAGGVGAVRCGCETRCAQRCERIWARPPLQRIWVLALQIQACWLYR